MAMFVSYVFLVLRTSLFLVANDQLIPITTNTNRNTMPYPRFGKRLGCLGWPGATRQLSLGRVKITLWNMKIMIYIMIYIAQGACCLLLLLLLLWADDTREKGKFTIILYQRAWGRREHNPCNYHCIAVYCSTQITNQLKETNKQDKHWLVFLAGGFAGIFSWVTTYPQVERYNIIASWRSWKCSKLSTNRMWSRVACKEMDGVKLQDIADLGIASNSPLPGVWSAISCRYRCFSQGRSSLALPRIWIHCLQVT